MSNFARPAATRYRATRRTRKRFRPCGLLSGEEEQQQQLVAELDARALLELSALWPALGVWVLSFLAYPLNLPLPRLASMDAALTDCTRFLRTAALSVP